MISSHLAVVNYPELVYFGAAILIVFLVLFAGFWFGWWLSRHQTTLSPYSGMPLRKGTDISYMSVEKVLRFLYDLQEYDNRMFDLNRAAVCRETGRIFPECITWYGYIKVDWSFLQKRFPGRFVSWGSLTEDQKREIQKLHHSLAGFQTDFSSPHSIPRMIEPQYAFAKPGPLYVDVDSKVLVGWKCVPDTELEVLIIQRPKTVRNY